MPHTVHGDIRSVLAVTAVAALSACAAPITPRPAYWAQPVEGPGLDDVYRVTDDFHRGPNPSSQLLDRLREMGVRTVVSLRFFHDDEEFVRRHGLDYARVPIKVWAPEDDDIVAFLAIATDPSRQPIYVHCTLGLDRTGLVAAAYRVNIQGWSKEEAILELTRGGYGFWLWQNLVCYLRDMDVEAIKSALARPASAGSRPPGVRGHGQE